MDNSTVAPNVTAAVVSTVTQAITDLTTQAGNIFSEKNYETIHILDLISIQQ